MAHLDLTPTCSRVRRVRGASARDGGRNVKRFRGGLVFKAHKMLYLSNLVSGVIKKRGTLRGTEHGEGGSQHCSVWHEIACFSIECCDGKMRERASDAGQEPPWRQPRGKLYVNLHRCYLREVAFEWELTKETIYLPLGCLQGGQPRQMCRGRSGCFSHRWFL